MSCNHTSMPMSRRQALTSLGSGFGLAIGFAGLLWGSLGVTQAAQHAMAQIWNVPGVERPGLAARLLRCSP